MFLLRNYSEFSAMSNQSHFRLKYQTNRFLTFTNSHCLYNTDRYFLRNLLYVVLWKVNIFNMSLHSLTVVIFDIRFSRCCCWTSSSDADFVVWYRSLFLICSASPRGSKTAICLKENHIDTGREKSNQFFRKSLIQ